MRIAIVGAGHIGGNIARQLASAGHQLTLSFSAERLRQFANELGANAAQPDRAVKAAEVVVVSVPWGALPMALSAIGSLKDKIVIDTTNQFGPGPHPANGQTAASFNAKRMVGARYTKSFNTLTAAFQAQAAGRPKKSRVVQWVCGDDVHAKKVVVGLIDDAGFVPVDLGGIDSCAVMEAPRRPGAVYGEEWRLPEALGVVDALREGRPLPSTPDYSSSNSQPRRR